MSIKTELLIELEKVRYDLKMVPFLSNQWQELDKRESIVLNARRNL